MTPATLSIFFFALFTHDPRRCLHPGVILSGVTTSISLLSAALPMSSFSGATRYGRLAFMAKKRLITPLDKDTDYELASREGFFFERKISARADMLWQGVGLPTRCSGQANSARVARLM
jgi:hypothetical protein